MQKIRFHPAFWVLAFVMVWQGNALMLINTVVSACLHEGAHARAAYHRGYRLGQITLMPYGAVLSGAEAIEPKDALAIAAAGPLANLCIMSVVTALWWMFPALYPATKPLFVVNATIFIFNLLPVFPLDGGRMILAVCKNRTKTLKLLRGIGVALAVVLSAAFVASAFFGINYTLAIWAAMLYLSATGGSRDEQYVSLALNAPCLKDWSAPVSLLNVAIDTEYTLKKLLRLIRGDRILTVEIREGSRRVARLTEEEVCDLCMRFPLSTTVGQAISSFRPTADV